MTIGKQNPGGTRGRGGSSGSAGRRRRTTSSGWSRTMSRLSSRATRATRCCSRPRRASSRRSGPAPRGGRLPAADRARARRDGARPLVRVALRGQGRDRARGAREPRACSAARAGGSARCEPTTTASRGGRCSTPTPNPTAETLSDVELEMLRIRAATPRFGAGDRRPGAPGGGGPRRAGRLASTKGCYPGQEPIARLHYRGHANRVAARALDRVDRRPPRRTPSSGSREGGRPCDERGGGERRRPRARVRAH